MRVLNIKPEIYKNKDLLKCSVYARLMLPGLWMIAGYYNWNIKDDPKRIKAEIFPWDDVDIDALLDELAGAKMIVRHEAGGRRLIRIQETSLLYWSDVD
jgi:hypothetical protein